MSQPKSDMDRAISVERRLTRIEIIQIATLVLLASSAPWAEKLIMRLLGAL